MNPLSNDRWQLPDGVDELLPDAARNVERLRRVIVDCCHGWGFELVMPPMIEYLDSLLTGTGETMDLQTFKLVDQQNGRSLGVRADMTPQVARMDAHALRSELPNRLFYTGTVLRARTDGFGGSRSPLQFGAELFGHAGNQSDIEIIRLMLTTMERAGQLTENLTLDLGHVGVYRGLLEQLNLDSATEKSLFTSVQSGSYPDVKALLDSLDMPQKRAELDALEALMHMRGNETMLEDAQHQFRSAGAAVTKAISTLQAIVKGVRATHPDVHINVDLAELRGYRYHTGALFAAYAADGIELARGGRYDAVGAAFGHPRPATGFSGDLKQLADIVKPMQTRQPGVFVAAELVELAWPEISRLRARGERVVTALSDKDVNAPSWHCDRVLERHNNEWKIAPCK